VKPRNPHSSLFSGGGSTSRLELSLPEKPKGQVAAGAGLHMHIARTVRKLDRHRSPLIVVIWCDRKVAAGNS
jgi:hypothetical protein